jgi:hypothetical protein
MKEHKKDVKNEKQSSAIAQHCITNNHQFDFDNVNTLSLESCWKRRTIKESILTHQSFGKSINDVKYKLKVFG